MDVDTDNKENKKNMIKILHEEFPEKIPYPPDMKEIQFSCWKLVDLKRFLVLSQQFKGHSKSKKGILAEVAAKTWQELCSEHYFLINQNDARDEDIMYELNSPTPSTSSSYLDLQSPLMSPVSSTGPSSPPMLIQRYPETFEGMTIHDFEKWTVAQLQEYLSDRSVNKSGNKPKLVKNAYGSYLLDLPVTYSDPQQEKKQIEKDYRKKLILDNGLVTLPNPTTLTNDWVAAPSNIPDTVYDQVKEYLIKNNAGKAFKGGKSLLQSEHLFNVMVHAICPNVRYCFVRGLCHPEQKLSKAPYNVWVCLQKDTGEVITGDCACIAGVAGCCKHVGAMLWYIEEQVRLGNNKTCTSKKQQWSVPSKKQQALHSPDTLNNINISKPKSDRIFSPVSTTSKRTRCNLDPRSPKDRKVPRLTENDIDTLAEITNGNSGIVGLLRTPGIPNDIENLHFPASYVTVDTSEHIEIPQPLTHYAQITDFDDFMKCITITPDQRDAVQAETARQAESDAWFEHRKDRITASKFKDCVQKVNDEGTINNPDQTKSVLSKVCGYYPKVNSKATRWGISNEPVARRNYVRKVKSLHKNLTVNEPGFFIYLNLPFIGASPDGLVDCSCHEPGLLEIKCPWSSRHLAIKEYAKLAQSCLEVQSGKIRLKRNHSYFYQVQCQMLCTGRKWCDFFVCTARDNLLERIWYDETFMNQAIEKAKIALKDLIFPEIVHRKLKLDIDTRKCVKELLDDMISIVEIGGHDKIDFDINCC